MEYFVVLDHCMQKMGLLLENLQFWKQITFTEKLVIFHAVTYRRMQTIEETC